MKIYCGFNATGYMTLCRKRNAEFEVMLRKNDDMYTSTFGEVMLRRDGIHYVQDAEMDIFNEVTFTEVGCGNRTIALTLMNL